jgi:hypothetical protein
MLQLCLERADTLLFPLLLPLDADLAVNLNAAG